MTDNSISTHKALLQEHAARDILGDYKQYRREALSSEDPDAIRKLVEMQMRLIGAEPDKKQDQFAHLPTFNFIFHQGGVQATLQQVEVVQSHALPQASPPAALPTPLPEPEPLDLDDALSALDAKLKEV